MARHKGASPPIEKTRGDIADLLKKWGVVGIAWVDDFGKSASVLRFQWEKDNNRKYVARFELKLEDEDELESKAVDGRTGRFSQNKYLRLKEVHGRREHRLLYIWLKDTFEAVSEGIIEADAVFLPWIEDSSGQTVFERISPVLAEIRESSLPRALTAAELEKKT